MNYKPIQTDILNYMKAKNLMYELASIIENMNYPVISDEDFNKSKSDKGITTNYISETRYGIEKARVNRKFAELTKAMPNN